MSTLSLAPGATQPEDIVAQIVEAAADTDGTAILDLPPLQRTVDTAAIGSLVAGDGLAEIPCAYHDRRVTLGDDTLDVAPVDATEAGGS